MQKTSLVTSKSTPRRKWRSELIRDKELWIIVAFLLVYIFIFFILPMLGNVIAFIKYTPGMNILDCEWVGLQYFQDFFRMPDMARVLRNTLVMGGLNVTIGFVTPIILALLLNELHSSVFKRVMQTVSYLPYFVSWVVVAALVNSIFSTEGVLNVILLQTGLETRAVNFINQGKTYWMMITLLNIWKNVGYGSIIYLSAIAGIDGELYQAGAVDGLGRFGMVRHITLPGISSTIIVMFILNSAGIINGGFEQHLLLGTATTRAYYDTIDTYVYRYGLESGRYSFATAVGLLKGVVSLILLFLTNTLTKKISSQSIF